MRALLTNDDGISSPGLHALAAMARDAGLDVTIAAPLENSSGASAGITAVESEGRIVVEERKIPGLEDIPSFGVAAAPGFIALIASRGAFGDEPDVVLSGINNGINTGHAILHSGTVGATFTGCTQGRRGLAVSIETGDEIHWATAASVARSVLPLVLDAEGPFVLNLNVPNVPEGEVRGIQRARLATFGAVQTNIAEVGRGFVRVAIEDVDAEFESGTDAALLAERCATVTPLLPICEAEDVNLPGYDYGIDSSMSSKLRNSSGRS